MEESLKNLFAETINLIKQYGTCLLKDQNINRREWEELSSCMMHVCDESLRQDVTFKRLESFKQEIYPDLDDLVNVEDESVIFQFHNQLQLIYDKLELGRTNEIYKDFEDTILSKVPKITDENDITAVSENVNLVDPITKLRLTDPVKNVVCGHRYEKAAIMELLRTNKNTKCPIPGCIAATQIIEENLLPDPALKKYLKQNF